MSPIYSPDEQTLLDKGDFAPFRAQFQDFGDHVYFDTSGRGALPRLSLDIALESVEQKCLPWLVVDRDETPLREEVHMGSPLNSAGTFP